MPIFILGNPTAIKKTVSLNFNTEDEIRNAFEATAKSGGGNLREEDLKNIFRQLGSHLLTWRAFGVLQHADADKDGVISRSEFEDIIKYALSKYGPKNNNYN